MIASRIRRIAAAMAGPTQAQRELAYLDGSVSLVDLEARQRQVDRGLFRDRDRRFV